jgi:hypothetical protein
MVLDQISLTMTYMMWREERLCNVSVLQGVHVPILFYLRHVRPHAIFNALILVFILFHFNGVICFMSSPLAVCHKVIF